MAIIVVTRWKGNQDHAPLVKEGAAILKRHGALAVRGGRCFSGEYTGQVIVATSFADWSTWGRAGQDLSTDAAWQKFQTDVSKVFELQDRSVIIGEEF